MNWFGATALLAALMFGGPGRGRRLRRRRS
jgi:hypothetical protein